MMISVPAIYPLIMFTALLAGIALSRKRQARLGLTGKQRLAISLGAFCGSMLGSKIPFALADPNGPFCTQAWISDGKTIMFGLVGGYIGVEIAKALVDVHTKTGDSFAVPVAVAIGIGRLGCFVGKCCHGVPTTLPWGVDFGDGILRHPTQLYETAFDLSAAAVLLVLERKNLFPTQRFKLYLLAYCCYRILTEFIRPEIRLAGGLTGYQWTSIVLIPVLCWLWRRDQRALDAARARPSDHHRMPKE